MGMTETDRKEFKDIISDALKGQREWLEAVIHPIQKDLDKHDIILDKVPLIEQRIDNHLEDHIEKTSHKRFNIEMWVIVGIYLLDKIQAYFGG